ncbi:hypothetical protein HYPSUDRAFT_1006448 [Hypholoma sublateritium FD-334 SS-4]|uniref:Fungal-type protein kinase domain-containing protein n=1 Tax=Hypholoma sublateritium (strain FD-334 SS-4) TaxID=945553 RepID=A0A0D2KSZ1_HYPSF|nr:hypothetical protein HYPSUDRAFT_1006448 [Hypholoma sublateritium FD-334 SS-4]
MIYPPDIALDLKDAGSGKVQTAPSRGVLNDLELSELEPDENIQRSVKSHHHAGTFPFMARDLLARARYKTNGPANCHLYRRYDLESFYYMLIWAALTYTTQGRSCKAPTGSKKNPLKEWLSPDPKTVYYSKLILQGNDFNRLGGKVSREWVGLWEDWVEPLNRMFSKGLFAADQAPRNADANFDTATCDGLITFERFMDVIQETPR